MLNLLKENFDITTLSNFKTKAFTRYYYEINCRQNVDNISQILDFANENNLKVLFVWWGTNLLFAFELYNGIIIKNCLKWWTYDLDKKILEVFSSEKIWDIAESIEIKYWNDIWHRFIWLPWTIWWAIYWNAWCFWLEAESNLIEVKTLNLLTWNVENIDKINSNFSYRSSIFKETKNYFIISAKFDLSKKVEKYASTIDNIDFRENKQPKWNSCWSFFKNPSKELSAWFAIEQLWLKGYNHNWAYFSDLHANFLMSDWVKCSYKDLLYLIDLAQNKVWDKFSIKLEPEVRIIY